MQEAASETRPARSGEPAIGSLQVDASTSGAVPAQKVRDVTSRELTKRAPAPVRRPLGAGKLILTRVILLAVVVSVGLLGFEMMTRVIYNRNGMHFGIEMWKYAKTLKRPSTNPEMGHEHTPDREALLMGVPVKINSTGLRDREFGIAKPADTFRVLVLGDSTTFGWGVRQEKTFAKLLENKLNERPPPGWPKHVEVINAGVGNYNTAQEVAYFMERGRLYKPDMVILAFFINDAEPTPRQETSWLAQQSCLYVFVSSFWDGILRELHLRASYRDYYRSLYQDGAPGWMACQRAVRELMAACRAEQIDLRIAIIPELHSIGAVYEFRNVNDLIRRVARDGRVPVIDLLDGISVQDPPSLWVSPADAHPNARAMEMFATQLNEAVRTNTAGADDP
jgi:lysophospholipase L1-like esterase